MGGTNDNPTIQEFQKNTQALRVVNSLCRPVVKGNCQGNTEVIMNKENINCPLPRRSAKRRKFKLYICILCLIMQLHLLIDNHIS